MRRPASATALGIVLILVAALLLLSAVRYIPGYFETAELEGVATRMSLAEYLLERPLEILVPPFIGLLAAVAGIGVFGGRRWARPLAVVVGVATMLGGVFLLVVVLSELGVPGSFAMLFLPPGILALLIGAYVVYAALTNEAYLRR
ncbi:MAG: hypothetical protein ACXWWQ_07280 [Candidatus Limnocylindria bacterium]